MRNRDVTVNKGRFNQNQPSSSQHNTKKKNERQKDTIVYKESKNKKEKTKEVRQPTHMEVEKLFQISICRYNSQIWKFPFLSMNCWKQRK